MMTPLSVDQLFIPARYNQKVVNLSELCVQELKIDYRPFQIEQKNIFRAHGGDGTDFVLFAGDFADLKLKLFSVSTATRRATLIAVKEDAASD